uniref:CSON015104 protein n=1 Tax=Culicoides sonorensis TaxID=179676 RepID=A0A336M0S8_CULSO
MTEASEDDYLVEVRAQVMARDESTEGWLPLQGGGLAKVSIRKRSRLSPEVKGHEYIIYGQRIADQTVILSCVINEDLKYNKVMPTFHHWRAGKQRNGLTFQTAADARAFDKGIRKAYDALLDDLSLNQICTKPNESPGLIKRIVDEDVFMDVNLPMDKSQSRSTSEGSGSHQSIDSKPPKSTEQKNQPLDKSLGGSGNIATSIQSQSGAQSVSDPQPASVPTCDNYSYVQLTSTPDFTIPVSDAYSAINARCDSTSSLKKRTTFDPPLGPLKDHHGTLPIRTNLRCKYCSKFYSQEWNRAGSCDYAPDCFKNGIETISGMQCAKCMVYHCMGDPEGESSDNPCSCTGESGCTKRWIGLTLLSLIVPCLWCYPPLKACHWIGVTCGICGGRHKPQI